VKAFKAFAGAGHGELVVVGDFDANAIPAQVEKLFASWTSKAKYARLASKPFGVAGMTKTIDIKDKEMTVLMAAHDLAMRDDHADYPAWLIVGHLLGGDTGSRLWMRLREKEGLSYGTWAWCERTGPTSQARSAPGRSSRRRTRKAKAAMLERSTRS
jgi:zinc protease